MVKKSTEKKYTEEDIEQLITKGWESLDKAFQELIEGCKIQHMTLVVEALELTRNIAQLYKKAQLAQIQARKDAK